MLSASHRRWTADQVEIMRITLVLHDDLGVSLDHIAAKVAESGTVEGLLAMARTMESRLHQVEEDLNGLTERKSA